MCGVFSTRREQPVIETVQHFIGSPAVLCHELQDKHLNLFGKICAFIDLLPNSINVYTVPQEVTEVRLHAL